MKQLVAYWRDRFEWRAQERALNTLEQFTTNIDGLTIHFIHRRSKQPNAFSLLITHGPRRVEVPTACADFPKAVIWAPRRWLESRYNITRWTEMPRGGHFAAFEQPGLLVDDVRAFFRTVR